MKFSGFSAQELRGMSEKIAEAIRKTDPDVVRFRLGWLATLPRQLDELAAAVEEETSAIPPQDFVFSLSPEVSLETLINESTRDSFEEFCISAGVRFRSGGGSGIAGRWYMRYHFDSTEPLSKAVAWLSAHGARRASQADIDGIIEERRRAAPVAR